MAIRKLNGKNCLITSGIGIAIAMTALLGSTGRAQDTNVDLGDVEDDDDDRDTAEVIAFIISGAVLGIVLCLVITYCICSRLRDSPHDQTKSGNGQKAFVNDFPLSVSTLAK